MTKISTQFTVHLAGTAKGTRPPGINDPLLTLAVEPIDPAAGPVMMDGTKAGQYGFRVTNPTDKTIELSGFDAKVTGEFAGHVTVSLDDDPMILKPHSDTENVLHIRPDGPLYQDEMGAIHLMATGLFV